VPAVCIVVGLAFCIALGLPWWEDLLPLGLETDTPKGVLAGALLLVGIGALGVRGRVSVHAWAAVAMLVIAGSLVSFHDRVVRNRHFADSPFLAKVGEGFYVACVVWGIAFIALLAMGFVERSRAAES
jgi:hypothetical protein